jgi:hypothetical protein
LIVSPNPPGSCPLFPPPTIENFFLPRSLSCYNNPAALLSRRPYHFCIVELFLHPLPLALPCLDFPESLLQPASQSPSTLSVSPRTGVWRCNPSLCTPIGSPLATPDLLAPKIIPGRSAFPNQVPERPLGGTTNSRYFAFALNCQHNRSSLSLHSHILFPYDTHNPGPGAGTFR